MCIIGGSGKSYPVCSPMYYPVITDRIRKHSYFMLRLDSGRVAEERERDKSSFDRGRTLKGERGMRTEEVA